MPDIIDIIESYIRFSKPFLEIGVGNIEINKKSSLKIEDVCDAWRHKSNQIEEAGGLFAEMKSKVMKILKQRSCFMQLVLVSPHLGRMSASVMALPSNNDVVDTSNTKNKSSCSMIWKSFLHNDGHNDILRAQKIWDQRILTKSNSRIVDVVVV
ncbi:uncharacterized protein LOC111918879 isoform X2 [Lactuca sativa]|uniref:uncharacterized protein LOC111918879 isoform X2 n=1 Tax=Lactuca sativa TaxID=4236 RepID=UPI000CD881CC|nr:uncharacterized protein LOC111918879 isoform X2 [Lactuca sativa]